MAAPLRGTQSLVGQMGWVWERPLFTVLEICWRWIFGIPLLAVLATEVEAILAQLPPESAGLANLNPQNPWVAAVQLSDVWELYRPHLAHLAGWLLPASALAWVVVSGLGRSLVLWRMEPRLRPRPLAMIMLQAAWLALVALAGWAWFASLSWAAATHITASGEPDLVGYAVWVIFLSLGFFTLWALASWPLAVAPLLMLLEERSALSSLGQAFRLGRAFTSKLIEINLVMGIVKLALIVLAMVLSAAPLPFSDQLGPESMHVVWAVAILFNLVANDYFQVVRLKSFIEFWRMFREMPQG